MEFSSSVQTISWFRDRYREGSLSIKPPYQRKPVWAARQKCYLIESILMGLPVPEIYVQQTTTPEGETTYAIVDGQQRIRTVLQFIGSETDPSEEVFNKFVLDKLEATSAWRNLGFGDLTNAQRQRFFGYQFAVRYLNTDDDDEVRDMFKRLNKFLTPLKPQELRNAAYMGPFVDLVLLLADDEYWAENAIVTAASIRRMGDVEFVSELLIGVLHGPQGGSAKIIDEYYAQYEDYEDEFPDQKRAHRLFDETLRSIRQLVPTIKQTRWANKTDFYTLFVALAQSLRAHEIPRNKVAGLRRELLAFAGKVDMRLANESARVPREVVIYAKAAEKGVNDKKRRADRHAVLTRLMIPYLKKS